MPDEVIADREKPRIQTAARTSMLLLEVARSGPKGISAKQLAVNLELPRQVVYNLVHTLVSINMLRRATSSSYVLGLAVAAISHGFRRQLSSAESLNEVAEEIVQATGESAYVVGWLDNEIVVLASARGTATVTATVVAQGTASDAHARASGKLLLAMSAPEDVERYLQKHEFTKRTENTITDRSALYEELDRVRQNWVGIDDQEYAAGLSCLAVPFGKVPTPLVLGISAPTERFHLNAQRYEHVLRVMGAKLEPKVSEN